MYSIRDTYSAVYIEKLSRDQLVNVGCLIPRDHEVVVSRDHMNFALMALSTQ